MIIQFRYLAHKNKDTGEEQTVDEHLKETALLAGCFAQKAGLGLCGEVMGLIHDLGKYSDDFQKRIAGNLDIRCDHATQGAQILSRYSVLSSSNKSKFVIKMMILSAMVHHGGLIDVVALDGESPYIKRVEKTIDLHTTKQIETLGKDVLRRVQDIVSCEKFNVQCDAAIVNLKNGSGEGNSLSGSELLFSEALLVKFLYSCLIDADRTDTIRLTNKGEVPFVPWETINLAMDSKINSFTSGTTLNAIRKEIYERCALMGSGEKGFFKLSVPTGGGKTFASFKFALEHAKKHRLEHIIYVLPYTSIIEQNAKAIHDLLVENGIDPNILTESHSNIIIPIEQEQSYEKQFELTDNWCGQIVFTTMVQFLESVYAGGTRNIRRMHNMANSIIIFDEVQSLPIKCVEMANMLMRFLVFTCGSSVVLCTATQPLLDQLENQNRSLPKAINLITKKYAQLERVNVVDKTTATGYSDEDIAVMVLEEMKCCNSVLIIVNTKKSALDLYHLLHSSGYKVFYLSTNLCAQHRSDVIAEMKALLNEKQPIICVSTQLIEAGVDVDFNCVFRYIAGLDSIIQAAGRCNREGKMTNSDGEKCKGNVILVNSNTEKIDKLIDIYIGQQNTMRVMREVNQGHHEGNLFSESAINQYYTYYFYERKNEMCYLVGKERYGLDTNLFELMSENKAALAQYERNHKQVYKTRVKQAFATTGDIFSLIDNNQIGVVVPYSEKGKQLINDIDTMQKGKLLKRCQRYTVNLYQYKVVNGFTHLSKSGVYYLNESYYDPILGVVDEKLDVMDFSYGVF